MTTVLVNQTDKVVTIFEPGNIVRSDCNTIVMVSDKPSADANFFRGIVLSSDTWGIGYYSNCWSKLGFVQFTGDIKLIA